MTATVGEEQGASTLAPWTDKNNVGSTTDFTFSGQNEGGGTYTDSKILIARAFGFTIPSGATLTGIEVAIEDEDDDDFGATITLVKLCIDSSGTPTPTGNNFQSIAQPDIWTHNTLTEHTWEPPLVDLGFSLSVANVNHANFGLALQVVWAGADIADTRIRNVRIMISYTESTQGQHALHQYRQRRILV